MILEPKLASVASLRATKNELADMEVCLKRSREAVDPAAFEKWDERLHWSIATPLRRNNLCGSIWRWLENTFLIFPTMFERDVPN